MGRKDLLARDVSLNKALAKSNDRYASTDMLTKAATNLHQTPARESQATREGSKYKSFYFKSNASPNRASAESLTKLVAAEYGGTDGTKFVTLTDDQPRRNGGSQIPSTHHSQTLKPNQMRSSF